MNMSERVVSVGKHHAKEDYLKREALPFDYGDAVEESKCSDDNCGQTQTHRSRVRRPREREPMKHEWQEQREWI